MSRHEEWNEQVKLSYLLDKYLDPNCAFSTAIENVARSAVSGCMRKKRGVKAGLPDNLILYRGKPIFIELKSRAGRCSASQRMVREQILAAGGKWWEARSANAAMWALARSGVRFRTIAREGGTIERWQQPRLAAWELPRRDPSEPRPKAPRLGEAALIRPVRRRLDQRHISGGIGADLRATPERENKGTPCAIQSIG